MHTARVSSAGPAPARGYLCRRVRMLGHSAGATHHDPPCRCCQSRSVGTVLRPKPWTLTCAGLQAP